MTLVVTIVYMLNRFIFFQVLVVLTTDGQDDPLTDESALRLRQDGVGVFVVGIGKDVDRNVLRNISGDTNQVYIVPSIQGLSTVIRSVIKDIGNDREGKMILLITCTEAAQS